MSSRTWNEFNAWLACASAVHSRRPQISALGNCHGKPHSLTTAHPENEAATELEQEVELPKRISDSPS